MRLTNADRTATPSSAARITEPTATADGQPKAASARPSHWRPDIEGLRAVAVGAVIAAHIGFFYSEGGFIGVDVFFVISGFLITSLLLREIDRTGRVSIAGFYARRAVRLLPAAAVVLLATLIASWIWLPRTRLGDIATDAATAALNVVNVRLAMEGTEYLNADVEPSPLQHFWSLAVEEQFYLAWPLMLLAIALVARRIWGGRFARRGHLHRRRASAIALVLVLIAAGSLLLSVTQTGPDPVWSYFGIHTRAWELAAGALVAVAAARLGRVPRPLAAMASWAGLALIVASVFVIDERTPFPGYAAVLPVAGTALVIAAGCAPHRFGATAVLGLAPLQYIGKISYGLYLWHWPLIMIGPRILGLESPRLRDYILLMGIAFLLTIATFYLVENPIRTRKPLVQVPSRALAMGGGLITAALAVSLLASVQPMPTTDNEDAVEITGDETTVWDLLGEASDVDTVPANLTPSLEDAALDAPSIAAVDGCQTSRDSVEVKSECWYGDPDGEKTIVLFGDSHAAQWFPALNQLAEASGWRLLAMSKANCSVADVTEIDNKLEREYTECPEWKEGVFDLLEEIRPDAVVTTAYDDKEVVADDPDQAWIDGWVDSVERLQDVADEVYYIADNPDFTVDPPSCLAENPDDATECVGQLDESVFKPDRREDLIEAVGETGATVIDPIPWVCDMEQGTCPVVVGNILMYRDSNHFSARFAAELAPQLASAIPLEAASPEDDGGEAAESE
ncbi:acyltransferase family protein [Glycomyces harbinensis]|uniref:Peptidoglycan/LPS O-acetylase OafA/YrhL, contains acyltransferase and SGNH-hydrolase domains n=1 Tax=Glycomyces harbinensis TaxID=58114 RepID=A0A1G7B869_9ACTN|nr:acyltransferase family protein [Glycomyces harbinensis]SDE23318.1 Peptidoglycan/LPS O-acetylase OafA/YrhL, contains acyltransferase and SGNH-hydrolase domains [Glycomyces harbinensis]